MTRQFNRIDTWRERMRVGVMTAWFWGEVRWFERRGLLR